jgi:hypothetical protein
LRNGEGDPADDHLRYTPLAYLVETRHQVATKDGLLDQACHERRHHSEPLQGDEPQQIRANRGVERCGEPAVEESGEETHGHATPVRRPAQPQRAQTPAALSQPPSENAQRG